MATASDLIAQFLAPLLPSPAWRYQFGRWRGDSKAHRYAVLRPVGGRASSIVRTPAFSLWLIGRENDDATELEDKADEIVVAMRASSGDLVFLQPGEPAFNPTADGRPVFEIAVSAITD